MNKRTSHNLQVNSKNLHVCLIVVAMVKKTILENKQIKPHTNQRATEISLAKDWKLKVFTDLDTSFHAPSHRSRDFLSSHTDVFLFTYS